MLNLPNILTLSRIVTIPLLVFLLWWPEWAFGYLLAFALYCLMGFILMREIAVSGLREFLGPLQVSMPVSRLAKWKTAAQMVSLGALILGGALPWWTMALGEASINVPHIVGIITLWTAAVLTVITGWDYLRVGLRHMD